MLNAPGMALVQRILKTQVKTSLAAAGTIYPLPDCLLGPSRLNGLSRGCLVLSMPLVPMDLYLSHVAI